MDTIKTNGNTYRMKKYADGSIMLIPIKPEVVSMQVKRQWASPLVEEYAPCYTFIRDENTVYALDEDGTWGMAKCNSSDEFDYTIGQAIAIARNQEIAIPKFIVQ